MYWQGTSLKDHNSGLKRSLMQERDVYKLWRSNKYKDDYMLVEETRCWSVKHKQEQW